jgi:hypothetical protein
MDLITLLRALPLEDMAKHAAFSPFEEEPHSSWRDVRTSMSNSVGAGAESRLARKNPGLYVVGKLFGGSLKEATEKLAAVRDLLKEGGEWEQGSGGSASSGVMALTPRGHGGSREGVGWEAKAPSTPSQP